MDSTVLVAIISGSAGVGGSVLAQLVATRSTRRQFEARAVVDQRLSAEARAAATEARFEDEKRAACAELLYRMDMELTYVEMTRGINPVTIYRGMVLLSARQAAVLECSYRVRLVMPDLDPYLENMSITMGVDLPRWFGGSAADYVDRVSRAGQAVRLAMMTQLRIEADTTWLSEIPRQSSAPTSIAASSASSGLTDHPLIGR